MARLFISAHINGDLDNITCSLAARSVMLNKKWNKTKASATSRSNIFTPGNPQTTAALRPCSMARRGEGL